MNWRGILTRNWFGEKELSPFLFTITISEDMAGILFALWIALLPISFLLMFFLDVYYDIFLDIMIFWFALAGITARKRGDVYDNMLMLLLICSISYYPSSERTLYDYFYVVAAVFGVLIVVFREIKTYRNNRAKREALLPLE
jgi:hypothetical protein